MPEIIEFKLDDGTTVAVMAAPEDGTRPVSRGDRLGAIADKTLREALAPVTSAASQALDGFRRMARRPDEIEIGFGVTLDGKIGGIMGSASTGAHLDVKLRWHAPERSPDTEDGDDDQNGADGDSAAR